MSIQFDISNSVFSFSPCTNSWSAGLCLTIVGFCISYCAFGIQYLDYNSLKSFGSTIYGNAPVDNQIPVITNLSEPRATNASDNSDGDIEPTCHRSASIVPDEVPCSAHDAADTIMATELDTTTVLAENSATPSCYICMDTDPNDLIVLDNCTHSVHLSCIKSQINSNWPGKAITFGHLKCGQCRAPLAHSALEGVLKPQLELQSKIEELSIQKCREDGLLQDFLNDDNIHNAATTMESIDIKGGKIIPIDTEEVNTLPPTVVDRCMQTMACFFCHTCASPFCGGKRSCSDDDTIDLTTLICSKCAFEAIEQTRKCHKHGYKFAIYKCDSCCSPAEFDCRSNHYCRRCHDLAYNVKNFPCPGSGQCPLGIPHPPNRTAVHNADGEKNISGFVIGCVKCFVDAEREQDIQLSEDIDVNWKERFER